MSTENIEKGRALEKAVSLIQDCILRSDPKLGKDGFSIETNRWRVVEGVRHEIDVLVKTLPGSSYESSWIFECKNWSTPVGKNDVILLAEKVRALTASRGFLVAKSFSKDAEAQVRLDSRLSLIPCTDEFQSALTELQLVLGTHEFVGLKAFLKERGAAPVAEPLAHNLDSAQCICRWENKSIDFRAFLIERADHLAFAERKAKANEYRLEGTHWGEGAERFEFDPGELLINGKDFESLEIQAKFFVTAHKLKLISKFEVGDQGRVISFDGIENIVPGARVDVSIVHKFPPKDSISLKAP